jgi:glycosyltransferase involved in cell wall biosynthesis
MRAVRDELRERGVQVAMVTPFTGRSWTRTPMFAGRYAARLLGRDLQMWWYLTWHARYLARALRRELSTRAEPVVLYAQCPVAAAVALRVRGAGQRVVLVTHFNVSQADEWVGQREIVKDGWLFRSVRAREDRVLADVDALVHVSEYNQRLLLASVPATQKVPQAVIPNFIEPRSVARRAPQGDLVTVGGLEPRKNQCFLIEVIAAASQRGHRYSLAIIGEGPERQALAALSRRRGVEDLVTFLGYQEDPRALMAGYRLYCHAAKMESFGISLLEAMDAGLPIGTAAVGGIPEVVRDGVEGFFWPLDNPTAAAERLISVLEDEVTLSSMAEAARTRLLTTFTTERVAPRLIEFLCAQPTVVMAEEGSGRTPTARRRQEAGHPPRRLPSGVPTP